MPLAAATPTPVVAQTLLQSFFGLFSPKPHAQPLPEPGPELHRARPATIPWVGSQEDLRSISRSRRTSNDAGRGPFRTMCVRLCDGFYFPMSTGVSQSLIRRDEKACQQQCGVPARLFVMDAGNSDVADMKDLKGRRYSDLKTAFAYRKRLKNGCACRPMPWSAAERGRHQRYEVLDVANGRPESPGGARNTQADLAVVGFNSRAATDVYGSTGRSAPAKTEPTADFRERLADDIDEATATPAPMILPGALKPGSGNRTERLGFRRTRRVGSYASPSPHAVMGGASWEGWGGMR